MRTLNTVCSKLDQNPWMHPKYINKHCYHNLTNGQSFPYNTKLHNNNVVHKYLI